MKIQTCAFRGRSKGDWYSNPHSQQLELGGTISNSITSVSKDCLVIEIYETN